MVNAKKTEFTPIANLNSGKGEGQPELFHGEGASMPGPALKKLFFLSFFVLIVVILCEETAWAHHYLDTEPYFKYGIPAIILGLIIGCALGRKIPVISSFAGATGGMLVSGTVILIITGDLLGMFVASICLFPLAIFSGLVFGLVYHFFAKIAKRTEKSVQNVLDVDKSKNVESDV
jgi:hypothetical protein